MGKYVNAAGQEVEAVEYKDGDDKPKGVDNLADGTMVLTFEDGSTGLVHPRDFENQYKETK